MFRRLHRPYSPADYLTAYRTNRPIKVFNVRTGDPTTLTQQNQTANERAQQQNNCRASDPSCSTNGGRRPSRRTRRGGGTTVEIQGHIVSAKDLDAFCRTLTPEELESGKNYTFRDPDGIEQTIKVDWGDCTTADQALMVAGKPKKQRARRRKPAHRTKRKEKRATRARARKPKHGITSAQRPRTRRRKRT